MTLLDKGLKSRLLVVCGFLVVGLSFLSYRLVVVQVVQRDKWTAEAAEHYTDKVALPAARGRILDRNGELLARNQSVYNLVADRYHLKDARYVSAGVGKAEGISIRSVGRRYTRDEIVAKHRALIVEALAPAIQMPKHELAEKLRDEKFPEIVILNEIEEDFGREIQELLDKHDIRGMYLRPAERRFYPSPLTLTHVVGYVDSDGEGKEGVERVFNEEMRGENGYRYVERDRANHEIHAFRGDEKAPRGGNDVYLTIDMGLQVAVEEVLDSVCEEFRPEKVTTVWLNPQNGEVLAMASRPQFDLATRKGDRRNVAVSDFYEPGSTFKIVGVGAALDRGVVTPQTEIDCEWGKYEKEGFVMNDHHPYGRLTVEQVIAKSSNIGVYKIVRQLNRNTFFEYIQSFGFGRATGIELTAEAGGLVHDPSHWNQTSFSSTAIGYAIGVTPLQMAAAYSVVANGGKSIRPTLLKSIRTPEGAESPRKELSEVRQVISKKAADQLRHCLIKVTQQGGTGARAAMEGYEVAGKTGTAKKVRLDKGGYYTGRYVVSFAGFLPADNPQLLGLVMVDDPKAEGVSLYGGTIAAPIWKEMAEKAVRLLGIAPDGETGTGGTQFTAVDGD